MIAAVWTASLLLFIAAGLSVWKFADIAALDLPARVSIAFTCGLTVVATLMYVESAIGIRWSALTLGIPFAVIVALSVLRLSIGAGDVVDDRRRPGEVRPASIGKVARRRGAGEEGCDRDNDLLLHRWGGF